MTTPSPSCASDPHWLILARNGDDLWTRLKAEQRPILLWGMGNGADKLLDEMEKRGIGASGVFASDGFVREKTFHGFKITSFAQAKQTFGQFVILLAFATSLPDVIANITEKAAQAPLFVPDLPVYGDDIFDSAFVSAHETDLLTVRNLLADEESVALFDDVIEAKLTGDLSLLLGASSPDPSGLSTLLSPETFVTAADLGAYTGDTASRLLPVAPNLKRLLCFEPDPKTFSRLERNMADANTAQCYPFAAWDRDETLTFKVGGSRSSRLSGEGKTVLVCAKALDSVLDGDACDHIKFDVEGAEEKALAGCEKTIKTHCPALLLSLYHRSGDLFSLPLALHEMNPKYELFLRREKSIPAWDLNLIARLPKKRP